MVEGGEAEARVEKGQAVAKVEKQSAQVADDARLGGEMPMLEAGSIAV